jgi:hypothetical protein
VGQCQYKGVLISTMMAMPTLGRADGRERVGEDEVSRWFDTKIWSEGEVSGWLAGRYGGRE